LKSFTEAWIAEKVGEKLTDNTLRFYRAMCSTILEFYGEKAEGDIRKITRDDVVAFRQNQVDLGLTGKTVNHQLKVLRMIFLAALNLDKISKNPCPGVKTPAGLFVETTPFVIPSSGSEICTWASAVFDVKTSPVSFRSCCSA
jgi:site-specific recombinase XerC